CNASHASTKYSIASHHQKKPSECHRTRHCHLLVRNICRRHLWLSSCGAMQQHQHQQQVSNRMLSSTLHAMPLGTPGPSQIRQEIPECYQEPLSIVYLHHVSSDSRVFQPHCAQLWLNTLLRTPYHMTYAFSSRSRHEEN
ncbi:hypothetical protein JMJ77_0001012, partial [Colletotrichum scovillei]